MFISLNLIFFSFRIYSFLLMKSYLFCRWNEKKNCSNNKKNFSADISKMWVEKKDRDREIRKVKAEFDS